MESNIINARKYIRRRPSLSERLTAIADLVQESETLCDVGCDHALIPIELLQRGKIHRALAMDIIPGPLGKADLSLKEYLGDYTDLVELRLSDGLQSYRIGEAQSLVIAGMGGLMIRSILEQDPEKTVSFRELILGPQSDWGAFRYSLMKLKLRITEERLIHEDGKYYPLIRAVPTENDRNTDMTEEERMYGPVLLKNQDPVLREFLYKRKNKLTLILQGIRKEAHPQKAEELTKELLLVNRALERYPYEER